MFVVDGCCCRCCRCHRSYLRPCRRLLLFFLLVCVWCWGFHHVVGVLGVGWVGRAACCSCFAWCSSSQHQTPFGRCIPRIQASRHRHDRTTDGPCTVSRIDSLAGTSSSSRYKHGLPDVGRRSLPPRSYRMFLCREYEIEVVVYIGSSHQIRYNSPLITSLSNNEQSETQPTANTLFLLPLLFVSPQERVFVQEEHSIHSGL